MKLNTLLGLVFLMNRLTYSLQIDKPMSELALISISAVYPIRLNPILAHLSLVLGLITLFDWR